MTELPPTLMILRAAPMPVGITISGQDTIVPPHSVRRLAGILEKMDRPVLAVYREEMGHTSKPEDIQRVLDFVLDHALQPVDPANKTSSETTTEVTP